MRQVNSLGKQQSASYWRDKAGWFENFFHNYADINILVYMQGSTTPYYCPKYSIIQHLNNSLKTITLIDNS